MIAVVQVVAVGLPQELLVWALVVGVMFARFTAYVLRTWPRVDPTDDTKWDRRHG